MATIKDKNKFRTTSANSMGTTRIEETVLSDSFKQSTPPPFTANSTNIKREEAGKSTKSRNIVGAGIGVAIGAAAVPLAGMAMNPQDGDAENPANETTAKSGTGQHNVTAESDQNPNSQHAWAVGDIDIAESPKDDMSFDEAFAAARKEVGAGGAFEWRGGVYGTYYAKEWDGMTDEQKDAYESHFNWNKIKTPTEHHQPSETEDPEGVEVVSTEIPIDDPLDPENELALEPDDFDSDVEAIANPDDLIVADADDVDVLGVTSEEVIAETTDTLHVDGQDVILVDVNDTKDLYCDLADDMGDQMGTDDFNNDMSDSIIDC